MSAHVPRQPFGILDESRIKALSSIKNRQNGVTTAQADTFSFSSPLKPSSPLPSSSKSAKRSYSSFDDDLDTENVDPSAFSPTKRSKSIDGTPKKASRFFLANITSQSSKPKTPVLATRIEAPASAPLKQTVTSSSTSTPSITTSRGSPKHKRIGLLSKQRRASSSPITRIDPPSFSRSRHVSTALPFSIDAALSGTISTYSPKPEKVNAKPINDSLETDGVQTCMPKSWFFDIHEDTEEELAANLLEHSANILDISSDDDSDTKRRKEEQDRGKENIPPPEFFAEDHGSMGFSAVNDAVVTPVDRRAKLRNKVVSDAMIEDRKALGDLVPADYYGEGLDVNSHVIVDAEKPSSGLAHEYKEFDFELPASGDPSATEEHNDVKKGLGPKMEDEVNVAAFASDSGFDI